MTDSITRISLIGPIGGGKSALLHAIVSGQSAKSHASTFKKTTAASEHMVHVPIVYQGKQKNVQLIFTDLPGDDALLSAVLTKNPKVFVEADLALLLVPPQDKEMYVAAAKALDLFKAKSGRGKVICFLSKCDERAKIDGKTQKSIKAWCQVAERERILAYESLSAFDISADQIQDLLKNLAHHAHKASLVRLEAEQEKVRARAASNAKTCCTIA